MNSKLSHAASFVGLVLLTAPTFPVLGQEAILHQVDGAPVLQITGSADSSVNPGPAAGMRIVRGQVKQATPTTIVVEDRHGKEITMSVDPATAGDRDVRPGDIITGTVTGQGRAVAIHKESIPER